MADTNAIPTLLPLNESGLMLSNAEEDLRGRDVVDRNGDGIGKVDNLLIDEQDRRVHLLRVAHGGFLGIGATHFLIPADAVTSVDDTTVHIDRQRDAMADTPGYYDPELADRPAYYASVYNWWGYPPYLGSIYTPMVPVDPQTTPDQS
ncbi:MAG: PRC-barrel domain-containing protein [Thermomicrobiales bacterium]